ncbi:MAG: AmmeMemoRadiSam system protein A [Bdellovibrionales bacterium]|nr:AmmeMemoRadiSam system protein A [Bdellovibrionales bacterium]
MNDNQLAKKDQSLLLGLARQAIALRLAGERPHLEVSQYPAHLQAQGACFVTLEIDDHLRGCIGSLEAYRPLVLDVWENAQAAAFQDPRFPRMNEQDFEHTAIEISVLTQPRPLFVETEEDLLKKLRPGIDGLILTTGARRATFLPAVWESLPRPMDFLRQLKLKAGIQPQDWPADIQFEIYQSQSFHE